MTLCHGGGCGCKLSPAILDQLLPAAETSGLAVPQSLLIDAASRDDAAVWDLGDGSVLVATTDFFMPVVNDPVMFGRIAATNALSDVYAMGARPIMALALLGYPSAKLAPATARKILDGGRQSCAQAGIPVAGGHSIDATEPFYGLAVIGRCARDDLLPNSQAQAGDVIVLGKALGVGVLSNALRQDRLDQAGYQELIATTTKINEIGADLAEQKLVHALTDVTGFGLLGHVLEMSQSSGCRAELEWARIPLLPAATALARAGFQSGAAKRNWHSYRAAIDLACPADSWQQTMLTDPQTAGGLLAACSKAKVPAVLAAFSAAGFLSAAAIGVFRKEDPAMVSVRLLMSDAKAP